LEQDPVLKLRVLPLSWALILQCNRNNFFNNSNFFIFRETNESNLLLKEKADSLQGKLVRAEQRITELTRVEIENEVSEI